MLSDQCWEEKASRRRGGDGGEGRNVGTVCSGRGKGRRYYRAWSPSGTEKRPSTVRTKARSKGRGRLSQEHPTPQPNACWTLTVPGAPIPDLPSQPAALPTHTGARASLSFKQKWLGSRASVSLDLPASKARFPFVYPWASHFESCLGLLICQMGELSRIN